MNVVVVGVGLLVLIVAISVLWRVASWPCPSWLVPLLENPYFETVAGATVLLERAEIRAGMCVLDAGCGPGRVTLPVAAAVGPAGRVVALDTQAGMLEKLRRRLQAKGVTNVELLHAGLGEGNLEENQFDVALLVTVLGEIRDKPSALRELFRALRPGGVVSVTEALPDPHYHSLARIRKLSSQVGFEERAVYRGRLAYTVNLGKPVPGGRNARAEHSVGQVSS